MSSILFIVISILLSVSYAAEDNNELSHSNFECVVNEGSSCEVKMSAALATMKTEMLHIYSKLDLLGRKNLDLEENIHGKFHKLEKNILDKLEEYIAGKLDSMEKHLNRKIDALENNIPDKIDIILLHQKFDSFKKIHSDTDTNLICESQTVRNDTWSRMNEVIIQKLKIPDIEANVRHQLNALNINIPTHLEESINLRFNAIDESIISLKENVSGTWDSLNASLTQNINDKLEDIQIKIQGLESRRSRMENSNTMNIVPNNTQSSCYCKKRKISKYDFKPIGMDNETLNHVSLESDEDGIVHFEMHFAVKAQGLVMVQLSPVSNPAKSDTYLAIDIGEGQKTRIYLAKPTSSDINSVSFYQTLRIVDTPGILSKTEFKFFYVKIDKDILELGENPDSMPFIRFKDSRFRGVKYFGFTSWSDPATFLYDCPSSLKEMLE